MGAGGRGLFRRCLATAMGRRKGTCVPSERWAPTEEGRRVPSAAGSHRDEQQLRGAGFGIMDSFQDGLEPRSQRVRGVICSSKHVKGL